MDFGIPLEVGKYYYYNYSSENYLILEILNINKNQIKFKGYECFKGKKKINMETILTIDYSTLYSLQTINTLQFYILTYNFIY